MHHWKTDATNKQVNFDQPNPKNQDPFVDALLFFVQPSHLTFLTPQFIGRYTPWLTWASQAALGGSYFWSPSSYLHLSCPTLLFSVLIFIILTILGRWFVEINPPIGCLNRQVDKPCDTFDMTMWYSAFWPFIVFWPAKVDFFNPSTCFSTLDRSFQPSGVDFVECFDFAPV